MDVEHVMIQRGRRRSKFIPLLGHSEPVNLSEERHPVCSAKRGRGQYRRRELINISNKNDFLRIIAITFFSVKVVVFSLN